MRSKLILQEGWSIISEIEYDVAKHINTNDVVVKNGIEYICLFTSFDLDTNTLSIVVKVN